MSINAPVAFSQNRTEELSVDVWDDFVTPRFLDDIHLLSGTKPHIIIGGRGCGKTMLLRYHSFESQFSKKRKDIPAEALLNIGLYWRLDTQFASVMNARGLPPEDWVIAFEHFLGLYIGVEILKSLKVIARAAPNKTIPEQIESLNFTELQSYIEDLKGGIDELLPSLKAHLKRFEMWVSNVKKIAQPFFLPKTFLSELIHLIKSQCTSLENIKFQVFIDEFENLLVYQQQVVNTRIKHSQAPLIFNVAMKKRGFATKETLGNEFISNKADFRQIDLDDLLLKTDFELFSAEVFLLNAAKAGASNLPVRIDWLKDPTKSSGRCSEGYKKLVIGYVRDVLPGLSHKELAFRFFSDTSLHKILVKNIEKALINRVGNSEAAKIFINELYPRESVVCSALLNRPNLSLSEIEKELNKSKLGTSSKFDDWIENNLVGCVLKLYDSYHRVCPIYAGFETFVRLARGNLRHFLEICYKSINPIQFDENGSIRPISVEAQAQSARQASNTYLQEVRSFGVHGNQLHTFALRLGSLFALSHGRNGQSEPEINHFSFRGKGVLSEQDEKFLNEAIKWAVLFEEPQTKFKGSKDNQQSTFEYIFNPIYAPYFNISYRKKRRIDLTIEEFRKLVYGDYELANRLLRSYSHKWQTDLEDSNPTLFTHLSD